MARDIALAPKRVRRFQTQRRWKGSMQLGPMHVGKWSRIGSEALGWMDWAPACATPKQLEGWWLRGAPGRALSKGAMAPITCTKCLKILEEGRGV